MSQPPSYGGHSGNPWQAPPAAVPEPAPVPEPAAQAWTSPGVAGPASAPPAYPPPALEPPAPAYGPQPGYGPPPPGYGPAPMSAPPMSAPPGYGPAPMSAPPMSAPPLSGPPMNVPPPAWPGGPPMWGPGYPDYGPVEPPRRKRRGVLITVLVVVFVLLLGGGGAAAYLLTRPPAEKGDTSATGAAEELLQDIYVDQNPTKAAKVVCKAARDPKKIAAKIDEVKKQGQDYDNPRYTWTMTTLSSTPTQVVVSAKVKLTTDDVQTATETLKLTVVNSNGWFVCDVAQG